MVITDKFVYVHLPKTGGTFVTSVLQRLHAGEGQKCYGPIVKHRRKHTRCRQIQRAHRDKLLVSTVRCPYDWYVSEYEFGWWRTPSQIKHFQKTADFWNYPEFPKISFESYLELSYAGYSAYRNLTKGRVGLLTERFCSFYFSDPEFVVQQISDDYVSSGRYKEHMYNVRFLPMNCLNQDLYDFLVDMGYAKDDIGFVKTLGRIFPRGNRRIRQQPWQNYYTAELKKKVRRKDRLIFELFPEFDRQ